MTMRSCGKYSTFRRINIFLLYWATVKVLCRYFYGRCGIGKVVYQNFYD